MDISNTDRHKIRKEVQYRIESLERNIGCGIGVMSQIEAYESLLHFIDSMQGKYIDSLQEEPVSEDLEKASKEWLAPQLDKSYANYGETKMMELTRFDGYAMLDAIEFGAKWQKQQDQSVIELAEDHAMLAGMEKMKEEMMAKAIDGVVTFDYYNGDKTYGCIAHDSFCLEDRGLKDRDKVRIYVFKVD